MSFYYNGQVNNQRLTDKNPYAEKKNSQDMKMEVMVFGNEGNEIRNIHYGDS